MNVFEHQTYICMLYLFSLPTLPSSVTDYGRDQHGMQQYQQTITNILKKGQNMSLLWPSPKIEFQVDKN